MYDIGVIHPQTGECGVARQIGGYDTETEGA
jgi:hypothetical protein